MEENFLSILNIENLRFGWITLFMWFHQVTCGHVLLIFIIFINQYNVVVKTLRLSLTAGTPYTNSIGSETICPHPVMSISIFNNIL